MKGVNAEFFDLRMLEIHLLAGLHKFLAPLAEHLNEGLSFLLRVSAGLETPALGDFGDGGGQHFYRGLLVKAQEEDDLGDCLGDTRGDCDVVALELSGAVCRFSLESFEAQDCLECAAAVGEGDQIGDAEGSDDGLAGYLVPD